MNESRNASVTFLIVGVVLLLLMSFAGSIPVFVAGQPCPTAVMDCGPDIGPLVGVLMVLVPWLVIITGAVITINRMVRRHPSATAMTRAIMIAVGSWVIGLVAFLILSE